MRTLRREIYVREGGGTSSATSYQFSEAERGTGSNPEHDAFSLISYASSTGAVGTDGHTIRFFVS